MILAENLKMRKSYSKDDILSEIAKKYGIKPENILKYEILKERNISIDEMPEENE